MIQLMMTASQVDLPYAALNRPATGLLQTSRCGGLLSSKFVAKELKNEGFFNDVQQKEPEFGGLLGCESTKKLISARKLIDQGGK